MKRSFAIVALTAIGMAWVTATGRALEAGPSNGSNTPANIQILEQRMAVLEAQIEKLDQKTATLEKQLARSDTSARNARRFNFDVSTIQSPTLELKSIDIIQPAQISPSNPRDMTGFNFQPIGPFVFPPAEKSGSSSKP